MRKRLLTHSVGFWALVGGCSIAACSGNGPGKGSQLVVSSSDDGGLGAPFDASSGFFDPPPTPGDSGPPPPKTQPTYGPTTTQSVPPPPISGGTLVLSTDQTKVYAADPDRDALYIVDLVAQSSTAVALQAGDEPGRVAVDAAGRVHVVLRSGGAVATIDPTAKTVLSRTAVCARPRGIAYDATSDSLYVACVGGELVTLPAAGGAPTRTVVVEADLRDVLVSGSSLYVSELHSATILQIAADGTIASRMQSLPDSGVAPQLDEAWRMIPVPGGAALSLQQASSAPIPSSPVGEPPPAGAYGTPGGCMGAVTNSAVASWTFASGTVSVALHEGTLPVDIALSPDNATFAIVAPGEWRTPGSLQLILQPAVFSGDPPDAGGCGNGIPVSGQATAVAYDSRGRIFVQTREPAQLIVDVTGAQTTFSLSSISRDDTGHEIFHSNQGGGIACASCHIEGGDDGRTWQFLVTSPGGDGSGPDLRRTPSVLGTVAGTAPYHWDGSQTELPTLYTNSLIRMSGPTLTTDQETAFSSWLVSLPGPTAEPVDAGAVARGLALFQGAGACSTCHSGPKLTNNQTMDIGTGQAFQVPPLIGVSWRPPFLHDGCAATLSDAIGACGHAATHGGSAGLTAAQMSDLTTYLQSL